MKIYVFNKNQNIWVFYKETQMADEANAIVNRLKRAGVEVQVVW